MRKSAKKLLSGVMAGLMVVSMAPISALEIGRAHV